MKLLNIITPCSRPMNLHTIAKTINIPRENFRWIVVYDGVDLPNNNLIPEICEAYCYQDSQSRYGNYQRNFGLDLIKEGHIYFNDDDTTIHQELWENIKDLENDYITFNQNEKDGTPRLIDRNVELTGVDSHNFIFDFSLVEETKFSNSYDADGHFAIECYKKSKNPIHISKVLSIYNSISTRLTYQEEVPLMIQEYFKFFIR